MFRAAHVGLAMLQDIVGPLLKVRNTVLIALSTYDDKKNWFNDLLKRDDPQSRRLIKMRKVERVCAECKALRISSCPHSQTPSWHDSANDELAMTIINDEKKFAREVLGVAGDEVTGQIFDAAYVERIFTRPPYQIQYLPVPRLCITFFDPKGNSARQSYFAVVTLLVTPSNGFLLVGFDETAHTTIEGKRPFLHSYFTNLGKHPICANSKHLFVVESNFAPIEADIWPQEAADILLKHNPYCAPQRYNDKVEARGARTDHVTKGLGASLLYRNMKRDEVFLVDEFVVSQISRREEVREELSNQLKSIRVHNKKMDGKLTANVHDDMAVGLIIAADITRRYQEELHMRESILIQRDLEAARNQKSRNRRAGGSELPWNSV